MQDLIYFVCVDRMETLADSEIQEKVEEITGKEVKVIECEKSASSQTEEKLLINGFLVPLEGEEGARIKEALLAGLVPPSDLLNNILMRAGILKNPVELETVTNVKCTTKTTEKVTLRDKDGVLVDERIKEIEADDQSSTNRTELWRTESGPLDKP